MRKVSFSWLVPRFFCLQLLRPVAYAHIQRAGFIQMEVGIDAVPTGLLRRAAAWRKGGTSLFWPNVSVGIGCGQRLIFSPSIRSAHKKHPLSSSLSCVEDSIKKKGASVSCLKGVISYLMLPNFGKTTLGKRIRICSHTISRTLNNPSEISYASSPPHSFTKSATLWVPFPWPSSRDTGKPFSSSVTSPS